MKRRTKAAIAAGGIALIAAAAGLVLLIQRGFSARAEPLALEEYVASQLRLLAIPRDARAHANPVPVSPDALADGLEHFADHCAVCHGNDGSGNTQMGQGLYPKAPDMRLPATQDLSDGELFYIIENGIRFTGMPAWSTGTEEGARDSWNLVHFMRRLPDLTPDELARMEDLNPRSPAEIREEIAIERFLSGEDAVVSPSQPHDNHQGDQP